MVFKNYKINKDNEYIFMTKNFKIKLLNPSIQPFDYYSNHISKDKKNKNIATSINSILYFHYDIKVYHKGNYVEGKSTGPWVRDFVINSDCDQGITLLYEAITHIINEVKKNKKTGIPQIKQGNILFLNGFDEYIKIDRIQKNNDFLYNLELGDNSYSQYPEYCTTTKEQKEKIKKENRVSTILSFEELKSLGELIYLFIMDAIDSYEVAQTSYLSILLSSRYIKDNHLYESKIENKTNKKNNLYFVSEYIDNIYHVGDIISFDTIKKETFGKNIVFSKDKTYDNCIIKGFEKDCIILDLSNNEIAKINIYNIGHLDREINEEIRNYKYIDILKDWKANLNQSEKEDFVYLSIESLFKKYKEAIANRNYMYLETHELEDIVKKDIPDLNKINVEYHTKNIIKQTKELLLGLYKEEDILKFRS